MKQENKKAGKVIDAVELSKAQVEYIDNAIGYELQVIEMDNLYNQDRASLKKLLHEFLLSLLNDLIIKLILKKIFVISPLLILL